MIEATDGMIQARVRALKETAAPDVYAPRSFVPWGEVGTLLELLDPGVHALQTLVDEGSRTQASLARAIEVSPEILRIAHLLFAAPGNVGFLDGRVLPEVVPRTGSDIRALSGLLKDLGLWKVLEPGVDVKGAVRVALIAADANRRGFRRRDEVDALLKNILGTAVEDAEDRLAVPIDFEPAKTSGLPEEVRKSARFTVSVGSTPVAAIVPVFQATTGGRQQRDLMFTYGRLQDQLDEVPVSLIVIVDGRGITETPDHVLSALLTSVADCMTMSEAETGALREAIAEAATNLGVRGTQRTPLQRLIERGLEEDTSVGTADLPVTQDQARLALAQFESSDTALALTLDRSGKKLSWARSDLVSEARQLITSFDERRALSVLQKALQAERVRRPVGDSKLVGATLRLPEDDLVFEALPVVASAQPPDEPTVRAVALSALDKSPDSRLSVLVVPDSADWTSSSEAARLQRVLAVNVIVVDSANLLEMTQARTPRSVFGALVLAQADLSKASPFVLRGSTPHRIFFGRDEEEAVMLDALPDSSVALLGGRRIGKTSLLRHLEETLLASESFQPWFADCQTVRTWEDFAFVASREWSVRIPKVFKPRHLVSLVDGLQRRSEGLPVLLLDEMDQLIQWDEEHSEDEVPEAFFRACRDISQAGRAQFVFSGERTIAGKLWDPHSPHWNFCRPVNLRQLDRRSTEELLRRPLEAMRVRLIPEKSFLETVWRVTSGHPQIVQFLGDRIVRALNEREVRERTTVDSETLQAITATYEFREHYLETYWGQAVSLEKLISLLVAGGAQTLTAVRRRLTNLGLNYDVDSVRTALRMLELYGILGSGRQHITLRAEWLPEALEAYGGSDEMIQSVAASIDE